MVKTIEWAEDKVVMIDQTKLPLEVAYIRCRTCEEVVEAIKKLRIRGAPAIGIAAAMGVALAGLRIKAKNYDSFMLKLEPAMAALLAARPTAVNIKWAVERMRSFLRKHRDEVVQRLKELLIEESKEILEEDRAINRAIGKWGAQFINNGDTVLTHCNAGSLATGGIGTATAPMLAARQQGKSFQVIADETRPVLQGARLTAWELMQEHIPVTLITDNTAGALMKKGEINLAIVGTDRTARNGDVANKIGTYSVAVLCKEHRIPFYVAAPMSSIDFSMPTGKDIPIEERGAEEVTHIFGKYRIAPEGVRVRNLAFDVTPAKYVTALITEKGAFRPADLRKISNPEVDPGQFRIRK